MSDELEPLAPEDGMNLYVQHREGEVSSETLKSHEYRLRQFVEWCEEQEIYDLTDLSGRDLHSYRVHRREEDDLKPVTLQGQLSTLRVFLEFCASTDAVPEDLREKVLLPRVSGEEQASRTTLEPERAEQAIEYLGRTTTQAANTSFGGSCGGPGFGWVARGRLTYDRYTNRPLQGVKPLKYYFPLEFRTARHPLCSL